jgi:hypothetical protein
VVVPSAGDAIIKTAGHRKRNNKILNRPTARRFDLGQTKRRVKIHAPTENILKEYGFAVSGEERDKGWAAQQRRPTK